VLGFGRSLRLRIVRAVGETAQRLDRIPPELGELVELDHWDASADGRPYGVCDRGGTEPLGN